MNPDGHDERRLVVPSELYARLAGYDLADVVIDEAAELPPAEPTLAQLRDALRGARLEQRSRRLRDSPADHARALAAQAKRDRRRARNRELHADDPLAGAPPGGWPRFIGADVQEL